MKRLFWRAGLFRACLGIERRWAQTQHIVVQLPARAAAAVVKKTPSKVLGAQPPLHKATAGHCTLHPTTSSPRTWPGK